MGPDPDKLRGIAEQVQRDACQPDDAHRQHRRGVRVPALHFVLIRTGCRRWA
jgi:hypothetical protein